MSGEEQRKRFFEFIWENEQAFYDKYLVNLSEEELERFMKENPDFQENIGKKISDEA